MKNKLVFLLFCKTALLISVSAVAQTNWVRTPHVDFLPFPVNRNPNTVGPIAIEITPDGTILTLLQVNQNGDEWIYAFDTSGNTLWNRLAAIPGGIYNEYCFSFHATSDNGCVYAFRHGYAPPTLRDSIIKIGPNGNTIWSMGYWPGSPSIDVLVNGIVPSKYNTLLVQYFDSLAELDMNGNFIRGRSPFKGSVTCLPDSNLIVLRDSVIYKEDFFGTQSWNLSLSSIQITIVSVNSDFIYVRRLNDVIKVNTLNGNIIWTKPVSCNTMSPTSDLGFITATGDLISKFDSSGNLQWSKIISLPHFGNRNIEEFSSGKYFSGGCWQNLNLYYVSDTGYSPLLFTFDSIGISIVDTTHYFFNGNANDNYNLSIGDDGVYIAAAINNSGFPREPLARRPIGSNVFATNWSTGFASGLNYKYADVDGNGIIDMADLTNTGFLQQPIDSPYNHGLRPHWQRISRNLNDPELIFSVENDSISLSDTLKVHVILGSPSIPVDSIYGISFDLGFQNLFLGSSSLSLNPYYSIKPNSLGDTAINLMAYLLYNRGSASHLTSMVICRTNNLNAAFVDGDTLVTLYFIIPSGATYFNPITLNTNSNAITKDGFPVALNLVRDTLYISSTVGTENIENTQIRIYPNPANEYILFSFYDENEKMIYINDNTGRLVKSFIQSSNQFSFNVSNFTDGIYNVTVLSTNKIYRSKLIIIH